MNRSYVLNLINEDDIEEAYEIIELFIDNIAPIDYENYMLPDATNEILNSLHSNLNVNQKFISFITNLYPLFYDNNINYSVDNNNIIPSVLIFQNFPDLPNLPNFINFTPHNNRQLTNKILQILFAALEQLALNKAYSILESEE